MQGRQCFAVAHRIGEIFGEFGFELEDRAGEPVNTSLLGDPYLTKYSDALRDITMWQLTIVGDNEVVFDEEISTYDTYINYKSTKIVKLKDSTIYIARVRIFSNSMSQWGPWSEEIKVSTLSAVKTSVTEIGEDYVSFFWDRPISDNTNLYPYRNTKAIQAEADVTNYELRVLREIDMHEEHKEVFACGVRTATLYDLRPGTAYIVFVRYETLIGSLSQWSEVCRFYTQSAQELTLTRMGEDTFSVKWSRAVIDLHNLSNVQSSTNDEEEEEENGFFKKNLKNKTSPNLPQKEVDFPEVSSANIGYVRPLSSTIHKYELSIVGEMVDTSPIELSSFITEYVFTDLVPSTTYHVRVRSLSKEGKWGIQSKLLKVRLPDRPTLHAIGIGETFLSFTWTRPTEVPQEAEIEYRIKNHTTDEEMTQLVNIPAPFTETGESTDENKKFTIHSLVSGTDYTLQLRTKLFDEWGMWTEPQTFKTRNRMSINVVERGEDFITVTWRVLQGLRSSEKRYELILSAKVDDKWQVVFHEEVRKNHEQEGYRIDSLVPNTIYEIKGRAWQINRIEGTSGWGEMSSAVRITTLKCVAFNVKDIGEDFASLSWSRALEYPQGEDTNPEGERAIDDENKWADLKYEVVVGCEDSGDDNILHKEVLDNKYTITNLLPDTVYDISVRACNDRGQWGMWRSVRIRTLTSIKTSVHEIGESFARLMWRREDSASNKNLDNEKNIKVSPINSAVYTQINEDDIIVGDSVASEFCLFVFSDDYYDRATTTTDKRSGSDVHHKASCGYFRGGNAEVSVVETIPSHHTSFRVCNLMADRTYVMVIRATTNSGKVGMWSKEVRFHTVAPFRIPVSNVVVGENYVNLKWDRENSPTVAEDVFIGDYSVVSQQLRVQGTNFQYSKEHTLPGNQRELKLCSLTPGFAYVVQIRACNRSGEWGVWSAPVSIITRATIVCNVIEVADNYLNVSWEKRKAHNPNNYATGKGFITSYQLRVTNKDGIHLETFVSDGDCPFNVPNLKPDTYYCVEMKAQHNNEEWGLWSTPVWCLTLKPLVVDTQVISEEYCVVEILRPKQQKRLPNEDGNNTIEEGLTMKFGQIRPLIQLCVTTRKTTYPPHASKNDNTTDTCDSVNLSLPGECASERLVYLADITCEDGHPIQHTIPGLKANTIYNVAARSKLPNGEFGMWTTPTLKFVTVSQVDVTFKEIGESFLTIEWHRGSVMVMDSLIDTTEIKMGLGSIIQSRLKLRDSCNRFTIFKVESDATQITIPDLRPCATYGVSVQTLGETGDWGVWSSEAKVRTVPGMCINIENISEDAVWLSWIRDVEHLETDVSPDTAMNVDTHVKSYELQILSGNFKYNLELEDSCCFIRGLQPDTVYEVMLRTCSKSDQWDVWSSRYFSTLPTIRVSFGNIGEQFAVIEWRRNLPNGLRTFPPIFEKNIVEAEDVIEEYRLKVEEVGGDGESIVYELPPNISSYKLKSLKPSHEYRVWMCAKGYEGVWGLWNEESRFRTLLELGLQIDDIGEDYVTISWDRLKWDNTATDILPLTGLSKPSDTVKTWEIESVVKEYHAEVTNANGKVVGQAFVNWKTKKCTIDKLDLRTVYSVSVRAKDTYDEWGMWSNSHRFATLQPIKMYVLRVGESFVQLEWNRRNRLRKRKALVQPAEFEERDDSQVSHSDSDYDEDDAGDDESMTNMPKKRNLASGNLERESENNEESIDSQYQSDTLSEAFSFDDYPSDVLQADDSVLKWQVRVYGSKIFGGQPGANNDYIELFPDSTTTCAVVSELKPNSVYTIGVRAQNAAGEWGQWSTPSEIETQPLLDVKVTDIGEDYLKFSWTRPPHSLPDNANYELSFPLLHGVHNYQVIMKLLTSDIMSNNDADPRVYETSQPMIQLNDLYPGARYRVVVKEQMLAEGGRLLLDGVFGKESVAIIAETIKPMTVDAEEIGENHASLYWHRLAGSDWGDKAILASHADTKVQSYEVRIVRLDEKGERLYKGPMSLQLTKPFKHNEQRYMIPNLAPNAVYSVSCRARLESSRRWGLWGNETKFITQKRLILKVELINEISIVVSWSRMPPDWIKVSDPDDVPSYTQYPHKSVEAAIARRQEAAEKAALVPPALRDVHVGDYLVKMYEVVIDGITCDLHRSIMLPEGHAPSATVGELMPNHVYHVCVRSLYTTNQWSLYSAKSTICTLNPIQIKVGRYTERSGMVAWYRPPQSITEHVDALNKLRVQACTAAEKLEKQARFVLQQLIQQRADLGEEVPPEDLALCSLLIEQRAEEAKEAKNFQPDNVYIGLGEVTGYQLRVYGDGGMPFIEGTHHLLSTKKRLSDKGRKKNSAHHKKYPTSSSPSVITYSTSEGENTANEADDNLLLDLKINSKTVYVKIIGLLEDTNYKLEIRSRNICNEWGPWSAIEEMFTLPLLTLKHSRFGEHYINLFWQRPTQENFENYNALKQTVADQSKEFETISPQELMNLKETPNYNDLMSHLNDWRQNHGMLESYDNCAAMGKGEVNAAPDLPVKGYLLRMVNEEGNSVEKYFKEEDFHQHTLTNIQHNSVYVILMCVDYGNGEWGKWCSPLRVMTRNLIQIYITFVGEDFVDIDWMRAANKELPELDSNSTVVAKSRGLQWGYVYEVCLIYKDSQTGENIESRRPAADSSNFRVKDLQNDTHYRIKVRERDPDGQWSLWSNEKCFITLPGLHAEVTDIGEDWIDVSWGRKEPTVPVNYDDPTFVICPSEDIYYYLKVEELEDNGFDGGIMYRDGLGDADDTKVGRINSLIGDGDNDIENNEYMEDRVIQFVAKKNLQRNYPSANKVEGPKTIDPYPKPKEIFRNVEEVGEDGSSRYILVKKFAKNVNEKTFNFRITNLSPDRFYNIQVLSETTGSHIGSWIPNMIALTLPNIKIRCDLINEVVTRISWRRDSPRTHPRLQVNCITGEFITECYHLEAVGIDKKIEYNRRYDLGKDLNEFTLEGLTLNSCYRVRISATDSRGRQCLWSDNLNFVTLKPVLVHAMCITEVSIQAEWMRDPQVVSEYPATDTPLVIGRDVFSKNQVRLYTASDREKPFIDCILEGDVDKYLFTNLLPNVAYVVQARCSNVLGEWSLWSKDRVIYTMKRLTASIVTVGEDYISLHWGRDAPDELHEVIRGREIKQGSDSHGDVDEEGSGDDTLLRALQMKRRYPLLDRPEDASNPVYTSNRTQITKFCISISPQNNSGGWSTEKDGKTNTFTITNLNPDTVFTVAVRACYGDDAWGPWSEPVKTGTLNLFQINIRNAGEDYIYAEWHRSPNYFPHYSVSMGKPEETICYQCKVHDFTSVAIGEEKSADLDAIEIRDVFVRNKSEVIKNLNPNTRYHLSVRRWYKPIGSGHDGLVIDTKDTPMTEEELLRETVLAAKGLHGCWSEQVIVLTLKRMVVQMCDIAENAATIYWERDPEGTCVSSRHCTRVASTNNSFHLRIGEMSKDGLTLNQEPGSLHLDQQFSGEDIAFRACDLAPDTVYRVDIRCCADTVWGLWSKHSLFITLAKLQVEIQYIAEDYATLSWNRLVRELTTPDGTNAFIGDVTTVKKYHLEVTGLGNNFTLEKKFKKSCTSYRVRHLEPDTVYRVVVRSCDDNGDWSLWADAVIFATLKPIQLYFGNIAEQFVHVYWDREDQTSEEYSYLDNNVKIGTTDVTLYHFCVFVKDQIPSAAVIDKQFRGNVNHYCVTDLTPNTSYIIIIRACNSEEQWGLWCEEKEFMTHTVLTADIVSIGENYVTIKWFRDNEKKDEISPYDVVNHSIATHQEASSFHLCLTSEFETIDRYFTVDDCTHTADVARLPMYAVRSLRSDTKYILSIQACYGAEERGMWSKPITLLTLNNISIKVSNITESSAEFTWGRAQQNPVHVADPNVLVWRGAVIRYQVLLRKVDEMRAQEMREKEKASVSSNDLRMLENVTKSEKEVPSESDEQAIGSTVVTATNQEVELMQDDELSPHFFFEQEMEVKVVKYVQTLSRIDKLEINTEYHFQVRALDDNDEWGYWSEVFFDTPPCPPMNPVLEKDGTMLLFSWSPPDRIHKYTYCVEQAVIKEGPGQKVSAVVPTKAPPKGKAKGKASPIKSAPTKKGSIDLGPLDWRVVETVDDSCCRIKSIGNVNLIRCRVKCFKINSPTHLFSRYSVVASVSSGAAAQIAGVDNIDLLSISRSTALIGWSRADGRSRSLTMEQAIPAPPTRVSYRIMLGLHSQPLAYLDTTRELSYELTDLSPATSYTIQIQVETENCVSSNNPTLRFTTKVENDPRIYKWSPEQPPFGELTLPEQTIFTDGRKLPPLSGGPKRNSSIVAKVPRRPSNKPPPGGRALGKTMPAATSASTPPLSTRHDEITPPGTAPHRPLPKDGAGTPGTLPSIRGRI